jgi:hypothetical protein
MRVASALDEIAFLLKLSFSISLLAVSRPCLGQVRPIPEQLGAAAPVNAGLAADFSGEVLIKFPELRPGANAVQQMSSQTIDVIRPSAQQLECGLPEQAIAGPEQLHQQHRNCFGTRVIDSSKE